MLFLNAKHWMPLLDLRLQARNSCTASTEQASGLSKRSIDPREFCLDVFAFRCMQVQSKLQPRLPTSGSHNRATPALTREGGTPRTRRPPVTTGQGRGGRGFEGGEPRTAVSQHASSITSRRVANLLGLIKSEGVAAPEGRKHTEQQRHGELSIRMRLSPWQRRRNRESAQLHPAIPHAACARHGMCAGVFH